MGEKSKQGADNMKTLLTFVSLFMSSAVAVFASPGGDYPFRPAELTDVAVRPGFWLPRFETNRLVTLRRRNRRAAVRTDAGAVFRLVPSRRRRDADMVPRQMSFTEIKG